MTLAEVYDRNAGYWDSWLYRAVYYRAYIRLLRMLKRDGALGRPVRVLDCGIGAGLLSEALLHISDWVKAAGLTNVRAYAFSGIARFFARAYTGTKA